MSRQSSEDRDLDQEGVTRLMTPESKLSVDQISSTSSSDHIGDDGPAPDRALDQERGALSLLGRLPGLRSFSGDRTYGRGFRWSSVLETLVFLALVLLFNYVIHPEDPGYLSVRLHPFWVVVLLISIRYVFRESILCALLVAGVYVFHVLLLSGSTFHFSAISLYSDFKNPLLFLIVAGFISGYTQHLLERTQVLRRQLDERNREIDALKDRNRATAQVLHQLETRIAGEFTGILDLFAELARTKQMDSAQIKNGLLEVLVRYLDVEQASYYDLEHGRLIRRFSVGYGDGGGDHPNPEQDILLAEALRSSEVAHLGQFTQEQDLEGYRGLSLLAVALRNADGEVVGVASVEKMPFVEYNPHSFKLFGTILQWWGSVLDETVRLEELRARSVYNERFGLYNYSYFADRVAQEFERARRFSLPMSVALLRIDAFAEVEQFDRLRTTLALIVNQNISELEMAACYTSDDLLAISFPIAMATDAEEKVRRIIAAIESFDFHPYRDGDRSLTLTWATADYEIGMESHRELIDRMERRLEEQRITS